MTVNKLSYAFLLLYFPNNTNDIFVSLFLFLESLPCKEPLYKEPTCRKLKSLRN